MPQHRFSWVVKDPSEIDLPSHLLENGTYKIEVRDGDVYVFGNRDGLLYLAEVIARCALGGYTEGFHVHLPFDSDAGPGEAEDEIAIFAASETV